MQPQISIVIPTYNRSDLLRDALDSCYRSAAGLEIEILVVDDASPEDISAACAGHEVRLFRLDVNSGSSVARNRGISEAKGQYIKFLDSDDVLVDGALHAEFAEAIRTSADIVVSDCLKVALDQHKAETPLDLRLAPDFVDIVDDLLYGKAVPTSAALYKTTKIREVHWDPELSKLNDWDFFVSAALAVSTIVTLRNTAYRWRQHSGVRIINTSSFLKNAKEFYRILEKLEIRLRAEGRMDRRRELRLAQYLYKELRGAYRFDPHMGRVMLNKILALDPDFSPIDEERSWVFRRLCSALPIHPVLTAYGMGRRTLDRLR
jgi:glycosyltransferase involved in cell wall biosynthesis